MLPDLDAAAPVARLLTAEADTVVAHDSGRAWLFGHDTTGELRTITVGRTRVAVIGTCLTGDAELRAHVETAVRRDNYDALAALRGSYHLAVTSPNGMLAFGDVGGFRRVFISQAGVITVASSHADVLRRLVDAPVSRTWLAARLASPEMPNPLRESLSPFDGIRAIPAGHCLALRQGAARYTPYWTPPQATKQLADGALVLAEALTNAVASRVRAADGPVSVQLRRLGFHGGVLSGRGWPSGSIGAAVGNDSGNLARQ